MPLAVEQALVVVLALGQATFEQALTDLTSPDANVRFRTAQMLKQAAYLEAAVPLATLVTDSQDAVQLEAIAAELNIFLAEKIVPRKRLGLVVEVRSPVSAEAAFSSGPLAVGARPVPLEVLTALRTAIRDDNPRVGLEALYAFGTLASGAAGGVRRQLLRVSGPELAALVGVSDPARRFAAARVLGRVFGKRPEDDPVEDHVGDAAIAALNDRDRAVKIAAMQALAAMRYDRAVQALTDLFQFYGKGDLAEASLDALGRIANPASAALLSTQLTAKTAALRGIAVEGLARLGDRTKLTEIQAATAGERTDEVVLAVAFAASMLSNAPTDRLAAALVKPRVHDQAKQYLVELAVERSTLLSRHLRDTDPRIRADIADALALGGDAAVLPVVEPLTRDPDPQVAHAAERAVARLRATSPKPASQ